MFDVCGSESHPSGHGSIDRAGRAYISGNIGATHLLNLFLNNLEAAGVPLALATGRPYRVGMADLKLYNDMGVMVADVMPAIGITVSIAETVTGKTFAFATQFEQDLSPTQRFVVLGTAIGGAFVVGVAYKVGGKIFLRIIGQADTVEDALKLVPNKWIGSNLSDEATQLAMDSMTRRMSSLRAGGADAFEQVVHVGSRRTGWSVTHNRPPLATSDVDIAVNDWPWLKGSRHEANVIKKMQDIASEFEAETGLKVQLHLRSRYSKEQWGEYFGEYFR